MDVSAKIPPSRKKTLRRLFLTLFLRGHGSRGLKKQTVPKSVARKLWWTLILYALIGFLTLGFGALPLFEMSVGLHSMTFLFLGMFIASSAGEVLFNKEEADILLHRPVTPKELLWAKIRVLVEVSLWLAAAFNLVGFIVGIHRGGWFFPPVHAASTVLEAMFTTGCVVMTYELCLRWFGRERLDSLMTAAQVIISVGAVLSGQLLSQVTMQFDKLGHLTKPPWWIVCLPPAWFAGFDDAIVGSRSAQAWLLAAVSLTATSVVLWMAFGRLAGDYETGLRTLNETVSRPRRHRAARRWLERMLGVPPLRWWLRDPVERAVFLLTSAYLVRDRDVKLRLYPGLAPFLMIPVVFLLPGHNDKLTSGAFAVAIGGAYLGLVPMLGLDMLQFSQQSPAADIFRVVPMMGPAPLCNGARRAMMFFLALPMALLFALLTLLIPGSHSMLLLLLPGIIAAPVFALLPGLRGVIPLSQPVDAAKAAGRGLSMLVVMVLGGILGVIAALTWSSGYFGWMVLVETVVAGILYVAMRFAQQRARWKPLE